MLTALLTVALAVDAANPWSVCLDNAQNDLAIRECTAAEFTRQDARLNTVYKKVMATQDATGQALLKKAELAWISLRDGHCAWTADENRGGTLALLTELDCRVTMTRARADELESWLTLHTSR